MTLQEFNQLDDSIKFDTVTGSGSIVSLLEDNKIQTVVYKLAGFFVEVAYSSDSSTGPQFKAVTRLAEAAPLVLHTS